MAEMRPEDVPDEWLVAAHDAYYDDVHPSEHIATWRATRAMIAAVLPLHEQQLRQRAETAERELAEMREQRDWQPGRWHQVRRPDGSLWMETSDRDEAEAEARTQGWPLYRLWECRETEWRPEGGDRG